MDRIVVGEARLPRALEPRPDDRRAVIPRIIHQIWLGETGPHPPERFAAAAESWRAAHPRWEYRRWTGPQIEELFARAAPELLPLYRGYPYWVQRADAARYLVVYVHGGVYADMDIVCEQALEPLLDDELVLAPTEPLGISNDLMLARPGHPLFRSALDALPASFRAWHRPWVPRHLRVICGTGSLHLTRVFHRLTDRSGVRLLTRGEYGHGAPGEAFVRHIPGNTWAGWDTRALGFLGGHWKKLLRWVGWAVLVGLLVGAARGVEWARVLAAVGSAHAAWLLAAMLANGSILLVAAAQWRLFLPRGAGVPGRTMLEIVALTSTVSNGGPPLAGHAAAVQLLAARGRLGHRAAVSVVILDQLAEGAVKLLLIAAAVLFVPRFQHPVVATALAVGIPALAAGLVVLTRNRALLDRLGAPSGATAGAARFAADALSRLDGLRPARFLPAVALGLVQKGAEALAIAAVAAALGVALPTWALLAAVLAVSLSTLVGVIPANVGGYEASAFLVYRAAGLDASAALLLALVQHAAYLIPLAGTGWALEIVRLLRSPRAA